MNTVDYNEILTDRKHQGNSNALSSSICDFLHHIHNPSAHLNQTLHLDIDTLHHKIHLKFEHKSVILN